MAKDISLAKTSPVDVARAILEGVEKGEEDIAPDAMSRQVLAAWRANPKELERQFASM
jgi:short-subunit dehydrogenase